MASNKKRYLGDGVYADLDEFGSIVMTTEEGIRTTNRIVLDGEVLSMLIAWMQRMGFPIERTK